MQINATGFTSAFEGEVGAIADYYHITPSLILSAVQPLQAYFEHYWEMVFSVDGFEIITAGTGGGFNSRLKPIAISHGLSPGTVSLFEKCHRSFPEAIQGIKLCFSRTGPLEPTLYVRTKSKKSDVFDFLGDHLPPEDIDLLQGSHSGSGVLYGLGFSERQTRPYLKTYTVQAVKHGTEAEAMGFVSRRLYQGKVYQEHKTYLPEVPLRDFVVDDPRLQQLQRFLSGAMGYTTAGHVGLLHQEGKVAETKIYVERVGGIPTDFGAQ